MTAPRLDALVPMLAVRELGHTIEWYTTKLGFRVLNTFGDPPVWCALKRDAVEVFFNQPPGDCFPAQWPGHVPASGRPPHASPDPRNPVQQVRSLHIFYLQVTNIAGLHAELARGGVAPTEMRVTVYGMKEFELRDPDGYWLWFGEQTHEPPTVSE